jgi:hypothetical protein
MQRGEERGAAAPELMQHVALDVGEFRVGLAWRHEARQVIGQKECDAPIAFAKRLDAHPGHFARAEQGVELGR